jgi:adenylylsulfate kinase
LSELRKRDPKGIYKKFDNGEIKNVAGLDFQVDFPLNPDLLISFDKNLSEKELYDLVKHRLSQLGIIG